MVSESEFDRMDKAGEIYWTENGDGQPYGKIYLSESKGQIPNDFWGIEFGTNQRGSLEVEKLFDKRYFDFPKPVSLLSNIVMLGSNKDSIVVDFFFRFSDNRPCRYATKCRRWGKSSIHYGSTSRRNSSGQRSE